MAIFYSFLYVHQRVLILKSIEKSSSRLSTGEVGPESKIPMEIRKRLPSGYVKIAIENGHRNSGFSH